MNRSLLLVTLIGGVFLGCASANVTPSAVVTLDNNSPTADGHNYDWTYTITVSNGDLNNVESFEIFDVGGVVDAWAPSHSGWDASVQNLGGGLSDVTFTNESDPCHNCALDGFVIDSTYHVVGSASYDVTYDTGHHDDPIVGAPAAAATPEPASLGLSALGFLAVAGLGKARRFLKRNAS